MRATDALLGNGETLTSLVVSLRRGVLRRADHIVVPAGGQVTAEGTLDYLLAECEECRRLWDAEVADG